VKQHCDWRTSVRRVLPGRNVAIHLISCVRFLFARLIRDHFRSKNLRVAGSGIAKGAKQHNLAEACGSKLVQESAAFLRSSNSTKPVRRTLRVFYAQGRVQDKFRCVDGPDWSHNARQFRKYPLSVGVKIEDAVDDGNVYAFVFDWQLFRIRKVGFHIRDLGLL